MQQSPLLKTLLLGALCLTPLLSQAQDTERHYLALLANEITALEAVLHKAELNKDKDARVKFQYDWLRADLAKMKSGVIAHINAPRANRAKSGTLTGGLSPMKMLCLSFFIVCCGLMLFSPVHALDSTQTAAMNQSITGKSGVASINSSNSSTTTYAGVTGVRLGITLSIAMFYFLFVAWLVKSQFVAWAEGDIDVKEGFGSVVVATLMLLLIVFILTT